MVKKGFFKLLCRLGFHDLEPNIDVDEAVREYRRATSLIEALWYLADAAIRSNWHWKCKRCDKTMWKWD